MKKKFVSDLINIIILKNIYIYKNNQTNITLEISTLKIKIRLINRTKMKLQHIMTKKGKQLYTADIYEERERERNKIVFVEKVRY